MYKIYVYKDANGKEPIVDYLKELSAKADKNSRLNLKKIQDYINILQQYGKTAGEPYMKHLDEEIWELRPLRNRIFFCGMGWKKLHFTTSLHKKDSENT